MKPSWMARLAPFGAGLLLAAALPPFGWWPLGLAGMAWWFALVSEEPSAKRRFVIGWKVGLASFAIGISWFGEFSIPGFVLAAIGEAAFWGLGSALAAPQRWWAFPAAITLADALRGRIPFGGIPLAGVDLGQATGPLAPAARLGGRLAVVTAAAFIGVALGTLALRWWSARRAERAPGTDHRVDPAAAGALLSAAVLAVGGFVAPAGHVVDEISVMIVQGGGPRGFTESETSAVETYQRHVAVTEDIPADADIDLIMWPEDTVDVEERVELTPEGAQLAEYARRHSATLVAGAVEDATDSDGVVRRFHNVAVAWAPDGSVVGRYEKVRRVPYGEYFPFRSLVEKVATIPARDAVPGKGPGFIDTPAGPLGFGISYEGFFTDRARAAVRAGAQVYLIPTNAASFSGSTVPTQQLAAARLRAWETGRHVVQAGPTGYSGHIDDRGRLLVRSVLGEPTLLARTVPLRDGLTPYARWGDGPLLVLSAVGLAAGWAVERRRKAPGAVETA